MFCDAELFQWKWVRVPRETVHASNQMSQSFLNLPKLRVGVRVRVKAKLRVHIISRFPLPSTNNFTMDLDGQKTDNSIIKKQRQLAARLGRGRGQPTEKPTQSAPPARQIRPSTFKKTSTSSVLAAARSKAAGSGVGKNDKMLSVRARKNAKVSNTTTGKRKEMAKAPSRLASLVQSAAKDPQDDGAAFTTPYSPEDFWKNIREWSFVSDVYRQMQVVDDQDNHHVKPIPDTFINTRHYIMAWGPKCLAEARAQLVSEVLTGSGQRDNSKSQFILVEVETTWKSGRKARGLHTDLMDTDACHVQLKAKERCSLQFHCHDICGLVPVEKKDMVEVMLRGRQSDKSSVNGFEDSLSQFCMIGHSETQRKELNGLILKVSKRKWVSFCDDTPISLQNCSSSIPIGYRRVAENVFLQHWKQHYGVERVHRPM